MVIPARNDKTTIAPTVRACQAIPSVDLIIVVDDGSDDDTGQVARGAGAVVVRHSVGRGRGSALETGVKVVAMRDREDWPARHILIMDPDLGDSAVEATALVDAVNQGVADLAIGVDPDEDRRLLKGRTTAKMAARALKSTTGWVPAQPLATVRCVTREAANAVTPFAGGGGVDVAATIDLLSKGFTVVEIPLRFDRLSPTGSGAPAGPHIPKRSDVWLAVQSRKFRSSKLPKELRKTPAEQDVGIPYPYSAAERKENL